jgi:beta-glucosidase
LEVLQFPEHLVFGVATAAYQVEGDIENDWSAWERAGRLKDPAARGCGKAVDHWNRFEDDLNLVRDVGATAFRISIEWARVEPKRGHFDERALEGYRNRLLRMRERGIRPVVTLHHFTNPRWFHEETPWFSPESLTAWTGYAKACAKVLEGTGSLVITLNEPVPWVVAAYVRSAFPPGLADGNKAFAVLANLARAHVIARDVIKARSPETPVGISHNMMVIEPDRFWHPVDQAIAHLGRRNYNHAFLEALTEGRLRVDMHGAVTGDAHIDGGRDAMDYLGVNYYTRAHMRFEMKPPWVEMVFRDRFKRGLTHIGWEDFPEGFTQVLLESKQYGLPVWVTENGIDDREGTRRNQYLHSHWKSMLDARAAGVDVQGYLHWSLLDNFEWLEGWGPRFGLYRVDFETLERVPTPSVEYFRAAATTRKLVAPGTGGETSSSGDPREAPRVTAA